MSRRKLSTTVYVEPEQDAGLKELHKRTNVPVAVFIREGIELVLAKYGITPESVPPTNTDDLDK